MINEFFFKYLIDHSLLFKNVCFRHYNLQTLKILRKHCRPNTTSLFLKRKVDFDFSKVTLISRGQRWKSRK